MPVVDRVRLIVWQRHDVWTLVSATFSAPQFTTIQSRLGYSVPHMEISEFSNILYENFY